MVRSENATIAFLGPEYSWSQVAFELRDVQPLSGGIRIYLPAWTISQFFVTKVSPGGEESKYKLQTPWDTKEELCRLCIEKDFITIRPEERAGIPDEARPEITLTNRRNESHTVSKWAGVIDERFDAVYDTLLAMEERTAGQRPMPTRRFSPRFCYSERPDWWPPRCCASLTNAFSCTMPRHEIM